VLIEAQTEGRARAVETVRAEFRGTEPVIAFNPHYLLDGLTAALVPAPSGAAAEDPAGAAGDTADGAADHPEAADPGLVSIEFTSPAKPALITRVPAAGGADGPPGQAPDFRYLVVPLRAVARS
jgi:DNA polymerase III sliding clamp (beta) subunit (PCNA family)